MTDLTMHYMNMTVDGGKVTGYVSSPGLHPPVVSDFRGSLGLLIFIGSLSGTLVSLLHHSMLLPRPTCLSLGPLKQKLLL